MFILFIMKFGKIKNYNVSSKFLTYSRGIIIMSMYVQFSVDLIYICCVKGINFYINTYELIVKNFSNENFAKYRCVYLKGLVNSKPNLTQGWPCSSGTGVPFSYFHSDTRSQLLPATKSSSFSNKRA